MAAAAPSASAPPSALASFTLDRARAAVDAIPADRRVVLLGESTHGTEEFYRTRAEITKHPFSKAIWRFAASTMSVMKGKPGH